MKQIRAYEYSVGPDGKLRKRIVPSEAARYTLGMYYAKQLVVAELRAAGRKPNHMEAREIKQIARTRVAEGLAMADRSLSR
jgi:hypothetical protein